MKNKLILIGIFIIVLALVFTVNTINFFQAKEIEELKNRINVLEEYVETTSLIHKYEVEEIFTDIECIEQNLNYLFGVGDACEESFPDKGK